MRLPRLHHRFDWVVLGALVFAGLLGSFWLWENAHRAATSRDELEFSRQVEARHALIHEALKGYEQCLLAMQIFMAHGRNIDQASFGAMARKQLDRYPGFIGIQWAPRVPAAERATWERDHAGMLGPLGRIGERGRGDSVVVASPRAEYFPIVFAEPYASHRHIIGADVVAKPLRAAIEASVKSGQLALSGMLRLIYETGANDGLVMICPVLAPAVAPAATPPIQGFLLGIFRVANLLGSKTQPPAESNLEVMFVDEEAADRDHRVLYCEQSHREGTAGAGSLREEEFRRGLHRSISLSVAGRNWSIIYRQAPGSRGFTLASPLAALLAGLVVTALASYLGVTHLRRTRIVQGMVEQRTRELRESRRHLDNLIAALPGVAFRGVFEQELHLNFISDAVLTLTGHAPADLVAGRIRFRDLIHPDDRERVKEHLRQAAEEGREFEMEYRIQARDGGEKWILARGRAGRDDAGRLTCEGLGIDITAQKRAEAARLELERKLLDGQKMESLGLLAGGLAHDFNNLLSTVVGNLELARLGLPSGHRAEGRLRTIETAAVRAAELCRQLLAYAGKGHQVIELVDLSSLAEELAPVLQATIPRPEALRLDLARGIRPVAVDATQMRQIVTNLVLNAADATEENGGEIVVTTGMVQAAPSTLMHCFVGEDLPVGKFVFLEVRDTGIGMTPEVMARIFDPFFTTKPAGRGLGLAGAIGMVRGHRGALGIASTPGVGSTFRLMLPAAGGSAVPFAPAQKVEASSWQHRGRVLVVDDESAVRSTTAEMLRSFGLDPLEAGDGAEALEIFRQQQGGIELVVLNLLMPVMNGEQTLVALRAIEPGVRVLLVSGQGEGDIVQRRGPDGPLRFLGKPFTRAGLEKELRELLGET